MSGKANISKFLDRELQRKMYKNLITDYKYHPLTKEEIAKEMGISVWTLYKYANGIRKITAGKIASLTRVTGDLEYFETLCSSLGFILVKKIKDKGTTRTFSQLMKLMESAIK